MYIALCDIEILRSEEVRTLKEAYLETLREAVKADQPYYIVSHRYDEFDH